MAVSLEYSGYRLLHSSSAAFESSSKSPFSSRPKAALINFCFSEDLLEFPYLMSIDRSAKYSIPMIDRIAIYAQKKS